MKRLTKKQREMHERGRDRRSTRADLYVIPPGSMTCEAARPATRTEIASAQQALRSGDQPSILLVVPSTGGMTISSVRAATNREILSWEP